MKHGIYNLMMQELHISNENCEQRKHNFLGLNNFSNQGPSAYGVCRAVNGLWRYVILSACLSSLVRHNSFVNIHRWYLFSKACHPKSETTKSNFILKNGVFWVVTPCGSCKNRRFGGTWRLLHQGFSSQRTSVASCSLCCS
jgi:hypothetical protein